MSDLTPLRAPVPSSLHEDGEPRRVPQVLIAPCEVHPGQRNPGPSRRYLSIVPSRRAARSAVGGRPASRRRAALKTCAAPASTPRWSPFEGECLRGGGRARGARLRASGHPPSTAVVAVGGGKCVDAGKCVAWRLAVPAVICPSLASNDAPCSALSVMYTPEGVFTGVEFFPPQPRAGRRRHPSRGEAPVRYPVAGMGDAMATWYEARTCRKNPDGRHRARGAAHAGRQRDRRAVRDHPLRRTARRGGDGGATPGSDGRPRARRRGQYAARAASGSRAAAWPVRTPSRRRLTVIPRGGADTICTERWSRSEPLTQLVLEAARPTPGGSPSSLPRSVCRSTLDSSRSTPTTAGSCASRDGAALTLPFVGTSPSPSPWTACLPRLDEQMHWEGKWLRRRVRPPPTALHA